MSCLVQCRRELGRVAQIFQKMKLGPAPIIKLDADMKAILACLAEAGHGRYIYVVGSGGALLGCIGRTAILRYIFFYQHDPYSAPASLSQLAEAETAAGFMREVRTAGLDDDLVDVLERMIAASIEEIPVVTSDGRPQALLTMGDLLNYYQRHQGERLRR